MITGPFLDGIKVLNVIENAGYQAFFVGGSVRDHLLQREIGDIDITTSASPEQIQALFPKVIPVGIEHGTVIVRHNHVSYEVTTFRLDGKYSDQRHPDKVKFVANIDEDLRRRDFTVNAMAMDRSGVIIDLFKGKDDLKEKKIRTVGNGFDRFTEDPLRIIRALRFVSQMGFTIEQDTLAAMIQVKDQIESLAVERIKNEMTKFFAGEFVNIGLSSLKKTEIYKHLPIMRKKPEFIEKLSDTLVPLHSFGEVIALFHYLDQTISINDWIKAWKCSNKEKHEATQLIMALTYYHKNTLDEWLVYELPTDYHDGFIRVLNNIDPFLEISITDLARTNINLSIHSKHDLCINGNDLMTLFPDIKRGAWINQLLCSIEQEVVFNRIENNKTHLKEWIRCNPPVINSSNY